MLPFDMLPFDALTFSHPPQHEITVEIRIEAEECCAETIYTLEVPRRAPSTDPTLSSIDFVYDYVNNTGPLASAWVIPESSNCESCFMNIW